MGEVICVKNDAKAGARCHALKIDLHYLKSTKNDTKEEKEKEKKEEKKEKKEYFRQNSFSR